MKRNTILTLALSWQRRSSRGWLLRKRALLACHRSAKLPRECRTANPSQATRNPTSCSSWRTTLVTGTSVLTVAAPGIDRLAKEGLRLI